MDEKTKDDWELRKLQAEVNKLESEVSLIQSNKIRAWVTAISISVGIIVSSFGIYKSLSEIAFKNRQQAMEATIKSHQIFLNDVLDRMSGIIKTYEEADRDGNWSSTKRERFGGTAQVGAYGAALSLACEFDNLKLPATNALKFQVTWASNDSDAKEALEFLENNCK